MSPRRRCISISKHYQGRLRLMDLPACCHTCHMHLGKWTHRERVKQPASRRPLKIEGKAFLCPPKITCPQSLASEDHIHCEQPLLLKTHMWQAACLKTTVLNTGHLQLSLSLSLSLSFSHLTDADLFSLTHTLLSFVRKVFSLCLLISLSDCCTWGWMEKNWRENNIF